MLTNIKAVDFTPIDPLCQTLIDNATGKFEGRSSLATMYTNVAGNFDNMGLSVGILQWNYGSGSLQPLLRLYISRYGAEKMDAYFDKLGKISPTATMGTAAAITESKKWQDGITVKEAWRTAWKNLLGSQEFTDIQNEKINTVWSKTLTVTQSWSLSSIRAKAFFLDIVTQNGSMSSVTRALVEEKLQNKDYLPHIISNTVESIYSRIQVGSARLNGDTDFLGVNTLGLPHVSVPSQAKLNAIAGVYYKNNHLYFDGRVTKKELQQVLDILADAVAPQIKGLFEKTPRAVNYALWDLQAIETDGEKSLLFGAAYERAQLANATWWLDVFNRKGTIAAGTGRVHTELYDFNKSLFIG
jgi:hypothetical protein